MPLHSGTVVYSGWSSRAALQIMYCNSPAKYLTKAWVNTSKAYWSRNGCSWCMIRICSNHRLPHPHLKKHHESRRIPKLPTSFVWGRIVLSRIKDDISLDPRRPKLQSYSVLRGLSLSQFFPIQTLAAFRHWLTSPDRPGIKIYNWLSPAHWWYCILYWQMMSPRSFMQKSKRRGETWVLRHPML